MTTKQKRSVKLPTLLILLLVASCVVLNLSPTSRARAVTQYGGTLTVGISGGIGGFCIQTSPSTSNLSSYRSIYESLVERDSDGVLRPYLAETVTPNSQNTSWTITLRSGIKYHNGEAFDAANVKLNFDNNRAITGYTDYPSLRIIHLANVLTVTVIGTLTLRVDLELPQIDFLETLYGDGTFFMRATEQLSTRTTCSTSPIGTGPFKLTGVYTYDSFSVVRNDVYWRSDKSGNRLPYLDGLRFVTEIDGGNRQTSLQNGTFDAALFLSVFDSSSIKNLRLDSANFGESDSQNVVMDYIVLNAAKSGSPLRSINARKALAAATDASRLREFGTGGLGELHNSLFPSRSVMQSTEEHNPYDLAKAKLYKAAYDAEGESGPAAGVPFSITIPSSMSAQSILYAQLLKSMWEEAGITVNINSEESAVIISKMFRTSGSLFDAAQMGQFSGVLYALSSASSSVYLRSDPFNPDTTNSEVSGVFRKAFSSIFRFHENVAIDTKLLDARAQLSRKSAATKFRSALSYFQSQVYDIPLASGFVALFANRQVVNAPGNYLPSGHQATSMSNRGPDWSTVYVAGSQAPVSNKGTATTTQNIGWVGAQPKGLAVINSTEAYVARTDEGEICSVYLDNASVKSCFDVGGRPVSLVLNSDKTKLYFIDSDSNKVRRVVTSTGSVSDLVTLSSKPTAMALNKAETQLFVTSDIADVVYRVSTTGGSVLSTISVPGGPEGIAIEADGQTMWISQSEYGSVVRAGFAAVANQALDSLTNATTISVGNHPAASVLSADGKYLIVANIDDGTLSRIDTQTSRVTLVMQVGAEPNAIALDEQKNVAIIAYRFANSIGQVDLPAIPVPPAVVPVVEPVTTVAPLTTVAPVTTTVAPVATTEAPITVVSTLPPLTYSTQASAKISVAPALSLKKPVTNKSIVTYSKLVVASTSKVVVKVPPASVKYCKLVGTSVKALKVGSCKVTVTVTPKKGKPTTKTVTLKVSK